ncbi:MAG: PASTA domain-containing protein [Eubacterium sp.]
MREIDNLCQNCFEELTQGSVCASCGYDNDLQNDTMYLPAKTILQGKYAVGAVKCHESDAVTYAGYDGQIDKPILIREFLPKGIANRLEGNSAVHVRQKYVDDYFRFRDSFVKLWTTMQKLHSLSAVVPVYDVFEENDTAYAIIEDMPSIPMREYLLHNDEGYILWDSARLMFMPVLTTLEALHNNGIIHGSITPDRLVLCRDGKVRLSPFCIQEAADFSTSLEFVCNEGYTALEQYENRHSICPATDIYAFSACIYRALVGSNPPSALARETNDKLMIPNSIAEKIPMHVIKALVSGLQIYPEKRTKRINDYRELIDAAPAVQAKAAPQQEPRRNEPVKMQEEKKQVNKRPIVAILVLLIMIGIASGVTVYLAKNTDLFGKQETTTAQPVAQQHQVPNFINGGLTQSDVENNGSWNQWFTISYVGEYSKDTEEGLIFKQSVAAGETVDEKAKIVLTVSKGIQTETIPNVGGLALDVATQQLEALGFKVSTVTIRNDGMYTPNTVKANGGVAPQEGSVVAVGDEIILQVYGEVEATTEAPEEVTNEE